MAENNSENFNIKSEDASKVNRTEIYGLIHRMEQHDTYVVVAESITGHVRLLRSNLQIYKPFEKKFLYYAGTTTIDFAAEKYNCKEGYEIGVDCAIEFHISDFKLFHREKNAMNLLKLAIADVVKKYVAEHTCNEVRLWNFDTKKLSTIKSMSFGTSINEAASMIDAYEQLREERKNAPDEHAEEEISHEEVIGLMNQKKVIEEQLYAEMVDKFVALHDKCGISVDSIKVQNVKQPDEINKMKEENAINDAKNARMVATAKAELTVAEKKAEAQKLQGQAEADNLSKKVEALVSKLGTPQTAEQYAVFKAILLGENANYTVIEGGSNQDTELARLIALTNAIKLQGQQSQNANAESQDEEKTEKKSRSTRKK